MADLHSRDDQPLIIIPARYGSSRFPGKPLERLAGAGGVKRSLIEWTWRAACKVPGGSQVIVATDDKRIAAEVESFGGAAVMTPEQCSNGTERCAAALAAMNSNAQIVVNFQGDAPLTPPSIVAAVIERMRREPNLAVATPVIPCGGDTLSHLLADQQAGRVGGTTVVFNRRDHALYFSKTVIPYVRSAHDAAKDLVHLHLGIYAYRAEALAAYVGSEPSALELAEGLEQLRFLDLGIGVGTILCKAPDGSTIELNNPTDVPLIEAELQRRLL